MLIFSFKSKSNKFTKSLSKISLSQENLMDLKQRDTIINQAITMIRYEIIKTYFAVD